MNIIKSKTFRAVATFGLKRGYREELIPLREFKLKLVAAQAQVHKELDIQLSTKISHCDIVFSGQDEPSIEISFIQYPKFPKKESVLREGILKLVEILMKSLDQNRVVIVFDDKTYMLEENSENLDPGINF
ncbi:hypothetical protein C7S20_05515 [Christiangramia fulva]|uniref:Uncharacterized protein n=1 Tax=Christiangramia fulva TaxID=2126553 RepID=A0A2R3Z3C5_9FLAO|nr:hypothetical protein [Christiangramia fulva]AVR44766.1 hypothetical protein C7S20_05515 [Christiangramia fulva]